MALRQEYALAHSRFNDFLFAFVAEEKSGQNLTVLSAMSRLGLNPWGGSIAPVKTVAGCRLGGPDRHLCPAAKRRLAARRHAIDIGAAGDLPARPQHER